MSLTEAIKYIAVATEKCNITETRDNGFKIATMNMFKDLKKDMSKSINENRNSAMKWRKKLKTWKQKTNQQKIKIKKQTQVKLEVKNLEMQMKTSEVRKKESQKLKTK